jgi:hypothetical protein
MTEFEAVDRAESVMSRTRDPDSAAKQVRKLMGPFCAAEALLEWEARARAEARRNYKGRLDRPDRAKPSLKRS